jgi:hypothetical protein
MTRKNDAGLPREADKQMVDQLCEGLHGEDAVSEQADYVWDHLMGEPEFPTLDMVAMAIRDNRDPFDPDSYSDQDPS